MQFWKPRAKRLAAMVCALALTASLLPTAVFAEPGDTLPAASSAATAEEKTEEGQNTPSVPGEQPKEQPSPEPSESPAPSAEPTPSASPEGSPEPSESPEPVETPATTPSASPEGTPEPSESPEPAPNEVQTFAANAPNAAAEPRVVGGKTVDSDEKIFSVEYYEGLETDLRSNLTVIAVDADNQVIDKAEVGQAYCSGWTMTITLNDAYKTVYELTDVTGGDGTDISKWSGGFNDAQSTTFTWSGPDDDNATIYLHIDEASHVIELKDDTVDLGTITWKEGGKQLTTVKVYLNYDLVYTSEPLAISNALNNFVLDLKDGYYFNTVTMEDIQYTSSIGGQTFTYNSVGDYNRLVFGAIPSIFDGTNTVSLYVFNYEDGVQVKYDRYVNNGITNVNAACPSLDIAYTVNGYNTQFTYTDLDSYIYLPKNTKVTTTANVQDGYYFEYWHTADAAVGKNNLYTIGADGNPILQYTGPLEGQIGHVAFSQSMMAEYGSAFTSGIIGLYMTDGDRPVIDYYDYRITYCPNGENVTPADNQVQYFYRSSNGTYGTVIRGCMFTRDGYEFLGWNTKPDGTGTAYTPDAVYGSENGENDLTLYAQWEKIDTPPVEPSVALEKTILSVERGDEILTGNKIPAMLKVDDVVTYQIEVKNTGNVPLSGLTITDTLTAQGAKPVDLDDDDGNFAWKQEAGKWIGTVSNVALDANDTKTYKYTYTVVEEDKGKTISNAATVKDDGGDPTGGDETETEVENPDVTVAKSLTAITRNGAKVEPIKDDTELKVGDEITYQIEVKNTGNVNLSGLTVTDEFSGYAKPGAVQENDSPVAGAIWQEGETDTDPNWSLTIANIELPVGESKTYTYTYIVNQADAGNKLTNTAVVTGGELDPDDPDDEETDERPVKDDGTVTMEIADITTYMGGIAGYDGAVDDGNATESDSLPEPGFYFTLPDDINKELSEALDFESTEAVDLSRYITLTATDKDGETHTWSLKKYGNEHSVSMEDDRERYVYKIDNKNGAPIRVEFKNDGGIVTSDHFTVEGALAEKYTMSIYLGDVEVNSISFAIEIPDTTKTYYCGFEGGDQEAFLTVRHTTGEAETTLAVENLETALENTDKKDDFLVEVTQGHDININEAGDAAGVDVTHRDVYLLADEIEELESEANLVQTAQEQAKFESSETEAKYLDLVDANNGNAWLTSVQQVTVYWPYPAGTDENTNFKLFHYEGMDRDTTETVVPKEVTIVSKTETGITFKTSSFSPFVLVWDTTQPSGGGDEPSGGDDGNNDNNNNNNNNNTNTNNQTTTVNVANQAAAPAAAPAAAVIPQTGDDMPVGLLAGLALVAAGGLAALLVLRKRRSDR